MLGLGGLSTVYLIRSITLDASNSDKTNKSEQQLRQKHKKIATTDDGRYKYALKVFHTDLSECERSMGWLI